MSFRRKIWRVLIKIILIIFVSIVLFSITAYIVADKYENEIEEYAISQLNEQLQVKINIEDINLSVFKRFPYISVVFSNMVAWSNPDFNHIEFNNVSNDTLFSASSVYLQFSLFDLIRGNYKMKKIYAAQGKLNLLSDTAGKTNFRLFSNTKSSGKRNKLSFELEAVRLSDFDVNFQNLAKRIHLSGYIDNIIFKGKMTSEDFKLAAISSMKIHYFIRDDITYGQNIEASTKLIMSVKDKVASFKNSEIVLNQVPLKVDGNFRVEKKSALDIHIESRNFNLNTARKLLSSIIALPEELSLNGRGNLALKVSGVLSRLDVPKINAVYLFKIDNLTYETSDFRDITLKGKYSNGEYRNPISSSISIDNFSFNSHLSNAEGSATLKNFKTPSIDARLKGYIAAENFGEILAEKEIFNFSGDIMPDLHITALLNSFNNIDVNSIKSLGIDGNASLENLEFYYKDKINIHNLSGNVEFAGDSWLPDLQFNSNIGSFNCSLQLDHILKFLFQKQNYLSIYGEVEGKDNDLTILKESTENNDSQTKGFELPEKLFLKLNTSFYNFSYGTFRAEKIGSKLNYRPGFLSVPEMNISSMGGSITGHSALIQDREKNIMFRTQNDLHAVDIHRLFKSFNEFNQEFITSRNIEGILSGNVDFATETDSLLKVNREKTKAEASIVISSGELNHFEPMKKLSKYIELEELENIRFSNIENTISIHDEMIHIPQMDIHSNAFNITASGTHGFDGNFEYKLKVNLSELLAGKAKRAKKENEEFGVIEKDTRRTSLYLTILGNPDDYKIKYDKKEAVNQIKKDLSREKQTLQKILNEEFGWFKKDSISADTLKKKENNSFIFKWDEENDSIKNNSKNIKQNTEEEKLEFEWEGL